MKSITTAPTTSKDLLLHKSTILGHVYFNRAFAVTYAIAIFALIYHHTVTLIHSFSAVSFFLLVADVILGFSWSTTQSFRMRPIIHHVFPEKIKDDFPGMDIFICTADPYKEPPMDVVNTALSVMAYDYPSHMISVYVSDDGGSQLTLFAFMEAAKFARVWLPFCRKNNIMERCPEVFFRSSSIYQCYESKEIKMMYENMKTSVEYQIKRGKVSDGYICSEQELQIFSKWSKDFSSRNHPPIIQVLLESSKDTDISGDCMPNLIYVSRQKSSSSPHHFKAGALNALLRVSATMTNAPLVLTLDCDMYSNDPTTPRRMLCFLSDASNNPELGYVQFPQRFHGLNQGDIYASEFKRLFISISVGMSGFSGPFYVGTGCFFRRHALFGSPSSSVDFEHKDHHTNHIMDKTITTQNVLEMAHHVAGCNYEDNYTAWGSKIGFRYGTLVEDYYTGYRLQCEGWKSAFCHPDRAAFLGDIPITFLDALNQTKRWSVGLLEVVFSKYNPLTFGVSSMGFFMGYSYAHSAFWPFLSIPVAIYAFLPQLALIAQVSIFPKVNDLWFCLYVFLFLGAYVQDCYELIIQGSTFQRWWNEQRMWLARGLSSYAFGLVEYISNNLNIAIQGFDVTSKVHADEQSIRYNQGKFEFGVASPMFVPLASAALLNLVAFVEGSVYICGGGNVDGLVVQMFMVGFGVLNCLPIYEAMVFRSDKGKMPTKTTIISTFVAASLYATAISLK